MKKSTTFLCAAISCFALAACSSPGEKAIERAIEEETGGDAEVDVNRDGSVRVETDEGTFQAGNVGVPADWPRDIALYPGASVQYAAAVNPTEGEPGSSVMMTTTDDGAKVAAFYKEKLADDGWTVENSVDVPGGSMLGAKKEARTLAVAIGSGPGGTSITLVVTEETAE